MLSVEELSEIEELIIDNINEKYLQILTTLNRKEKLEDFLQLIGMGDLIKNDKNNKTRCEGKIIVIGQSEVKKEELAKIAVKYGIDKNRFEFLLDYEKCQKYNFKKTRWNDLYCVILVGEMPHSGHAKDDYSSMITALQSKEGYPPVRRVGMNGLKITKSSFRITLESLIDEGVIV